MIHTMICDTIHSSTRLVQNITSAVSCSLENLELKGCLHSPMSDNREHAKGSGPIFMSKCPLKDHILCM